MYAGTGTWYQAPGTRKCISKQYIESKKRDPRKKMGWEQTCGRRPGAATTSTRPQPSFSGEVLRNADDEKPLRMDSTASLLHDSSRKEDLMAHRPWSTRKIAGAFVVFIAALWVVCYLATLLLIESYLRFDIS